MRFLKLKNKYNPFTYKIPVCTGNSYVISDIHGCFKTLEKLVEKINLQKNDHLFFLGDYIDRGPNSKKVIDFIITLKHAGNNVYPIRGNHEDDLLLLLKLKNKNLFEKYRIKESSGCLMEDGIPISLRYFDFINKLPYFFELDNFIIVHAGFNFKKEKPYENTDDMVWIRYFEYDAVQAKNKTIIFGHTPYTLDEIKEKINTREKIMPLDNGCVYNYANGYGNLLCLNLKTYELTIQNNIDLY